MPLSSFIVKSIGPIMWSQPWRRSQASAVDSIARKTSGSSSVSRKPNIPVREPWNSLYAWSSCALMRPAIRPSL